MTNFQVEIDSDFTGFNCVPYWRLYPTDNSPDITYNQTNQTYYVKKEYDIRWYCTWTRLGILNYRIPIRIRIEFDLVGLYF